MKKLLLASMGLTTALVCLGSSCPKSFGIGWIVFHSNRQGFYQIFGVNSGGTDLRRVSIAGLFENTHCMVPDIRADGRVVFSHFFGGRFTLSSCNFDGSDFQYNLTQGFAGDCLLPRWSPDGRKIAFSHFNGSTRDIWEINADGSNPVQITGPQFNEESCDYSPDGVNIIFNSDRDGDFDIYRCRAGQFETNVVQLVNSPGLDYAPSYSPDGSKFCFASYRSGQSEIWRATSTGASQTQLTHHNAACHAPRYANISQILFMSSVSGNFEIYVMDDTGANLTQLTNDASVDGYPSSN
ncbi:MAG: TolB family protein [Fimbriimonadales bacterium]|nr:TolB family protein [Fimbriimonadales bacterium]